MKRLYFLAPDIDIANAIVKDLLLARIPEKHIHIIAKDKHLLEQKSLPAAGLLQESDVIPAMEKGVAVGGATGLVAGLVAVTFPPAGLVLGGGAVLITALVGAGFGAAVAPMIGISVPNSQLTAYEDAVQRGEILFLVDIPKDRVDEICDLINSRHSEADVKGTEPTKPAFP